MRNITNLNNAVNAGTIKSIRRYMCCGQAARLFSRNYITGLFDNM